MDREIVDRCREQHSVGGKGERVCRDTQRGEETLYIRTWAAFIIVPQDFDSDVAAAF